MAQHVLAVVARGLGFLDAGDAGRVQAGEQHGGLHLGGGDRHAIIQRQRVAGALDRQRQPTALARLKMGAAWRSAGRSPGCIGRRAQAGVAGHHGEHRMRGEDAAQQARGRCRNCPCRARPPAPSGRRCRARPPAISRRRAHISAPRARIAAAVRSTSRRSSRPLIRVSPTARAPNISARWLIDLSPGTRDAAMQRGGRGGGRSTAGRCVRA